MKNFIKANPPRFWFLVGGILIAILTIAGVSAGLLYKKTDSLDPNVLVVVGSEKITKQNLNREITKFFPDSSQVSKEQKKNILISMIDRSIVGQEAKKLGINLADEDYINALNRTGTYKGTLSDFQKLSTVTKENYKKQIEYEAFKDRITFIDVGSRVGNIAIARFDKTYEYEENIEKPEQITKDKEYAKTKIDGYRSDIESGKKTIKEVMELLDNDPSIGKPGWDNTTTYVFSFELTKTEYALGAKFHGSKDLWEQIRKQPKGLSEVMVFKDSKSLNGEDPQKLEDIEAFYALIQIDEAKEGVANFQEWLIKKYIEYKINIESIDID